jgi:dTDP-4-dehydrorhamnose reductase
MADTLLITGGSGYLGSCLARQACGVWHVVATYFSHPPSLPGCHAVHLDVRDEEQVCRLLADLRPRAVIHAAADMSSPAAMQSTIAKGTRNVAAAAAAIGVRLIHLSTDVLFDGEHAPYTESATPMPITPYGRAKAEAESSVTRLCPGGAIVRTSLIYGFDPPDPRTLWVLASLRQEQPITLFTDELRSPVWVEQLAAALLELAARDSADTAGVWHIAGPQSLSRYDFGARLARAYGLDPAGITPGLSRQSGLVRPRNCILDVSKARLRLQSPLWGVDQVLASRTGQSGSGTSPRPMDHGSTGSALPRAGS